MTYQVTLTPQAQEDLRDIFRYIALDLHHVMYGGRDIDKCLKNME